MCHGLHESCTMASVLFSLHFGVVVGDWRSKYSTDGVEFRYILGHKLFVDRKLQLLLDVITESQIANDATLYATSE